MRLRGCVGATSARTLFAVFLLHVTGCSAIFVQGPSAASNERPPECTRSRVAPVLDLAVAVGAGVLGAVALSVQCRDRAECTAPVVGGTAVGTAIISGLSAIYGLRQTGRCGDAWEAWCASHEGCGGAAGPSQEGELTARLPGGAGSRWSARALGMSGGDPASSSTRTPMTPR